MLSSEASCIPWVICVEKLFQNTDLSALCEWRLYGYMWLGCIPMIGFEDHSKIHKLQVELKFAKLKIAKTMLADSLNTTGTASVSDNCKKTLFYSPSICQCVPTYKACTLEISELR